MQYIKLLGICPSFLSTFILTMPALFTAQMHTLDFGDGGLCRHPPWIFHILSVPGFTSALEVPSNELNPLPTHFPWLTPSNALSDHLSDMAVFLLSYLMSCSDLWADFFPISLDLWPASPGRWSTLQMENMPSLSCKSESWQYKCYSLNRMNKWTIHIYLPISTAKWPLQSQKGHGHDSMLWMNE